MCVKTITYVEIVCVQLHSLCVCKKLHNVCKNVHTMCFFQREALMCCGVTKPRFVTACQPELPSTRDDINASDKKTQTQTQSNICKWSCDRHCSAKMQIKMTNTFFVMKYQGYIYIYYVLRVQGPSGPQILTGGPSGLLHFVLHVYDTVHHSFRAAPLF